MFGLTSELGAFFADNQHLGRTIYNAYSSLSAKDVWTRRPAYHLHRNNKHLLRKPVDATASINGEILDNVSMLVNSMLQRRSIEEAVAAKFRSASSRQCLSATLVLRGLTAELQQWPPLTFTNQAHFRSFHSSSRSFLGKTSLSDRNKRLASRKLEVAARTSLFSSIMKKIQSWRSRNKKLYYFSDEQYQKLLSSSKEITDPKVQLEVLSAVLDVNSSRREPRLRTWFMRVGSSIFIGIALVLAYIVYKLLRAGNDTLFTDPLSKNFEVKSDIPDVTFDDVIGIEEVKKELIDIVDFLKNPDKFTDIGAKLPKGVILSGPPGVGKTHLARAVAGEAGVPFFHASGAEFDQIFVGSGAQRVRELFTAAKESAPCVIFIDEFDSVGHKRTKSVAHPYANQTPNQLLTELDGFTKNQGVIVIGATNRFDNLDKAVLRAGRFDVHVSLAMPELKDRQKLAAYYLANVKHLANVDPDEIGRFTIGLTGADIENLVNQAGVRAAVNGQTAVTMSDIEYAYDKIRMGPARAKIPDQETNLNTAVHEAGHAIVATFTKKAEPVYKLTLIPRGKSLGHTSTFPAKEQYGQTAEELQAEIDVFMGGRAAQEIIFGPSGVDTGAHSDFQQATQIATAMVKYYGMSSAVGFRTIVSSSEGEDEQLSPEVQTLIDSEIKRILDESYQRAKQILLTKRNELKAVADALMKYETLNSKELLAILHHGSISAAGLTPNS